MILVVLVSIMIRGQLKEKYDYEQPWQFMNNVIV